MNDYRHHPEYLALMETVRQHPHDDAPRGIVADWIQEAGDDRRADFIRRQLADPGWRFGWQKVSEEEHANAATLFLTSDTMIRDLCASNLLDQLKMGCRAILRRGFLDEIHMPCLDFLRFAARFFDIFPITQVTLTDKQPQMLTVPPGFFGWHFGWYGDFSFRSPPGGWGQLRHWLPEALVPASDSGVSFEHAGEAMTYLSDICVAHGRRLAGLLPLAKKTS